MKIGNCWWWKCGDRLGSDSRLLTARRKCRFFKFPQARVLPLQVDEWMGKEGSEGVTDGKDLLGLEFVFRIIRCRPMVQQ